MHFGLQCGVGFSRGLELSSCRIYFNLPREIGFPLGFKLLPCPLHLSMPRRLGFSRCLELSPQELHGVIISDNEVSDLGVLCCFGFSRSV
jgi:hypothetical protein